jgi:vancomycin permeability regulator SanA
MGEWLVVETSLQKADLIVALGGSKERQEKAVDLLKQGFAHHVLFTGPDFRLHDYACLGITRQGIEPPMVAYRTYEEALVTKRVLDQKGFRSAIIVTSPYHLRRTRLIFTQVFADKKSQMMFYPSANNAFSMNNWWKNHYGRKAIFFEYLGLAYYGLTL